MKRETGIDEHMPLSEGCIVGNAKTFTGSQANQEGCVENQDIISMLLVTNTSCHT